MVAGDYLLQPIGGPAGRPLARTDHGNEIRIDQIQNVHTHARPRCTGSASSHQHVDFFPHLLVVAQIAWLVGW
jgi:hypothetical protein